MSLTPSLLLATTNPGKIREIELLLGPTGSLGVSLVTLKDLPPIAEPEETGDSFLANAALKADAYCRATGLPTLAEDSGLAIDALGGAPGIHSARYPGRTYPEKFANLYAALTPHPRPWTARYVCAVVIVAPRVGGPVTQFTTVGTCEGEIWPEPSGTQGFGYDPIFYVPQLGRTFGTVSDEEKLAIAHRGVAMRAVREWLVATRGEPLR